MVDPATVMRFESLGNGSAKVGYTHWRLENMNVRGLLIANFLIAGFCYLLYKYQDRINRRLVSDFGERARLDFTQIGFNAIFMLNFSTLIMRVIFYAYFR